MTDRHQPNGGKNNTPGNSHVPDALPEFLSQSGKFEPIKHNAPIEYSINWGGERCTLHVSDTEVSFEVGKIDPVLLEVPESGHNESSIKGVDGRYQGTLRTYADGAVVFELLMPNPNITVFATVTSHSAPQVKAYPDHECRGNVSSEELQEAAKQFRIFRR